MTGLERVFKLRCNIGVWMMTRVSGNRPRRFIRPRAQHDFNGILRWHIDLIESEFAHVHYKYLV